MYSIYSELILRTYDQQNSTNSHNIIKYLICCAGTRHFTLTSVQDFFLHTN